MTTKQCGNCQFWEFNIDKSMHVDYNMGDCAYSLPDFPASIPFKLILDGQEAMFDIEGQDCQVYVERQDAVLDQDDPPDENGYTRSDEDWFFDDKDD